VYILDDHNSGEWAMGAASRWWLHHSLLALSESLGGKLLVLSGDPAVLLPSLAQTVNAQSVHWNRCYEPWRIARDKGIKEALQSDEIEVHSHNGALLWEPWQVLKKDQTPYQVFTPYYRRGCLSAVAPRTPLQAPAPLNLIDAEIPPTFRGNMGERGIVALGLLPNIPWDRTMQSTWQIGEAAARARLEEFLNVGLDDYKQGRNFPERPNVSRLSPHLHFGEISPNQIWAQAERMGIEGGFDDDLDCFQSELGWREFSHALLYHKPTLTRENLQKKFDHFPWLNDKTLLKAWQQGQTGYPLVDAGMRELWQTGYMHNRVRMVVGSFLVKNLLTHWHHGEDWFWDCLVDADLAANSASWQWIAGCGADAAPYFRVFNPVTQSERFDPNGTYIRKYVPELAALPNKYLHNPGAAPATVLLEAGVSLGKDYPEPIVELKESRERALAAFKSL
jgi:deoxyribodipyrimidine photo-lyase